ncbi:sensor histidine kinase [Roseibium algae]|uniref:histidine kinase n=1 Tax=Roseibium algae TaxID=3123038 RepID=A0ABU8THH7_9HYPH
MSTRLILLALPPLVVMLIAALLVQYMVQREQAFVDRKAAERLTLYRQTILGEYEKYRYLPYMLARDPRATVVLKIGEPAEAANRFLEEMAEKSGADLLYVMDRSGNTLATSNWRDQLSLIGRNYSFRPYFQTAIDGGEGQFFAIGATIGEPGLFLSLPTPVEGVPDGVAVVKVDMEPLEKAWAEGGETVFATDANGVIFLASVADWRYRTLDTLPSVVRSKIEMTRQYADEALVKLSDQPIDAERTVAIGGEVFRHNEADVGLLGWTLHFLVPMKETRKNSLPIWVSGIGLSLLYLVGVLVYRGRALRRASVLLRKESDSLRELNQLLVQEVDERRRVESELRTAQRRLARSSRLAAVGQMSAAVAHELNQPLAAMRMFVAGARKYLEGGHVTSVEDNLQEIDALQHRMAALTQELKRFARPAESRIEIVDMRACIKVAEKIVRPRLEEVDVQLILHLSEQPLNLETAPLKVEQVLVNLLRNAADSVADAENREIVLDAERLGSEILVKVSDSGEGVPEDLREKIFDPFFTTKLSSGGLGLGLSISDRIAEDLGGTLKVQSGENGGATFVLRLPAPESSENMTDVTEQAKRLELTTL